MSTVHSTTMHTATLPADLYETDDAMLLVASLPGVRPEDLEVQLDQDRLTVTATRHEPVPAGAAPGDDTVAAPLFRELGDQRWQRSFRLRTPVLADEVQARLEHGELTITLPKAPAVRPRTIEVRAG